MSAIPPDADIERWTYDVRFVPETVVKRRARQCLARRQPFRSVPAAHIV
jgi:hypothetical protein